MPDSKEQGKVPSQSALEDMVLKADAATYQSLPNKVKPQVLSLVSKLAITQTVTQFSGPLPPPEELAKYEQILPGSAERLIAMVEHQSSHRMKLESFVIERQQTQSSLGQGLGFVIALCFLIGSVYTTVEGFPWVGGVLGGTTIIS